MLETVAINYMKIRTGIIPHVWNDNSDCDEFTAAILACSKSFLDSQNETKSDPKPLWSLPIVHLLNFHIKEYYPPLFPITFQTTGELDDAARELRQQNSRRITIMCNGTRTEIVVDSRAPLRHYMMQELNLRREQVARFEPPQALEEVQPAAPNRRRRSYGISGRASPAGRARLNGRGHGGGGRA